MQLAAPTTAQARCMKGMARGSSGCAMALLYGAWIVTEASLMSRSQTGRLTVSHMRNFISIDAGLQPAQIAAHGLIVSSSP